MNIREIVRVKPKVGDIGIEIEVEGTRIPNGNYVAIYSKLWKTEVDNSLKAEEALEYVLREPVPYDEVKEALDELEQLFINKKSVIHDSIRAGIHVHINVQSLTAKQLATFITCYLCVENILVEFCGESRVGNLFCLRTSDAEAYLPWITYIFKKKDFRNLKNDDFRYASMNLKSVAEYGSVEFRAMKTTSDFSRIKLWIDLLYSMYQNSLTYRDPKDVVLSFSGNGYKEFIRGLFGEYAEHLPVKDTTPDDIYDGVCNAQDFAYAIDWNEYKVVNDNPFKAYKVILDGNEPMFNQEFIVD